MHNFTKWQLPADIRPDLCAYFSALPCLDARMVQATLLTLITLTELAFVKVKYRYLRFEVFTAVTVLKRVTRPNITEDAILQVNR
jgi:hypothetical protein